MLIDKVLPMSKDTIDIASAISLPDVPAVAILTQDHFQELLQRIESLARASLARVKGDE